MKKKDKKKKKYFDWFGSEEEGKKAIRKGTGQKDPYSRPDKSTMSARDRAYMEAIDRGNKKKSRYADGGAKKACKRAALMKLAGKRKK